MPDYISREEVLDSICTACEFVPMEEKENCPYRFSGCQEYSNVFAIPAADVVEVVRCGDCIYWRGENDLCKGICIDFGADGYCSEGKRKDGGRDDGI